MIQIKNNTHKETFKFEKTEKCFAKVFKFNVYMRKKCLKFVFILYTGLSHSEMVETKCLRDSRIKNFHELWCLVASGGLEFCVSSTSFQKSNIGWPQQPLTEKTSDIS